MFGQMDESLTFRTSSGTKKIADNICQRNCIEKKSDLHRMAYMIGLEVAMDLEKKASHEGDLMNLLAYYVSDKARKRIK